VGCGTGALTQTILAQARPREVGPTTAFASARALSPFAASRQADREIEQSRRRARSRLAGDSCSLYDGAEYRSSEIVGRGGIW
jgi:hypothetical protein